MQNRSLNLMTLIIALAALLLSASEDPRLQVVSFVPVLVAHILLGALLLRTGQPGWQLAMGALGLTAAYWTATMLVPFERSTRFTSVAYAFTILALGFALWKNVPGRSAKMPVWLIYTCLVLVWLVFTVLGGFVLLNTFYPKP
jgi:hypothetical protein